jgi:hypothetical protein
MPKMTAQFKMTNWWWFQANQMMPQRNGLRF